MVNPFGLTPKDVGRGVLLAVLLVVAWIGFEFGADIARYRQMSAALAALETCETDGSCEQAWAMIQAAKGGR